MRAQPSPIAFANVRGHGRDDNRVHRTGDADTPARRAGRFCAAIAAAR
jgi:hypothetical protein